MIGFKTEVPRTIDINEIEIPIYQTLWEMNMKTNLRIDRCVKINIVLAVAVAVLAFSVLISRSMMEIHRYGGD